jgi:glyoxalase family protein
VHHVAFRAPDDGAQVERQRKLRDMGVQVTDVRDRTYFRSIYFREPGGVLFEIATDGPGFTVDETPAELGTALRLPVRLENMRQRLEVSLPPLRPPHTEAVGG